MKKIRMFQVDAFAASLFSGNPAAVCLPDEWPDDGLMQQIASENNLAETAFVVRRDGYFDIRWFTPLVEVDLCGHATLASAHVIFEHLGHSEDTLVFHSVESGVLKVSRKNGRLFLDFPADHIEEQKQKEEVNDALGVKVLELYKGRGDLMAVLENETTVRELQPDLKLVSRLDARGLIVTARGDEVDFVSRFFGPQVGIDEDPVTGSAHTTLIPYWSEKTGKQKMSARQLSQRGGELECVKKEDRCLIGGRAVTFFDGWIFPG